MFDLVYNIDFELAAFVFTVLLFVETGICYPREAPKNKLFRLMACMVVVTEGFDIISAVTQTYSAVLPIWMNVIVNSGYFMSGLFLCFLLHYYIENTIVPPEGKSVLLKLNKIILLISEITVLGNMFGGYYFSISQVGDYVHGPLYLVLHVTSCWFVLCGSTALVINRAIIKHAQLISSFLFVLLYFVAVVLQTFFMPDILIIMPAASAMLIIAIFTLESPDYAELQTTLEELTKTKQTLEITNKKYYQLAYVDLMTGVQNRTAYNIRLEQLELELEKSKIIFMLADINRLKYLNDHLGHKIGDDAIIRAAKLLKKNFTEGCQCYRIGGDEFMVIGIDVTEEDFIKQYRQFAKDVVEEGKKVNYPFSVASGCQKVGQMTLFEAEKCADAKMYEDKMATR